MVRENPLASICGICPLKYILLDKFIPANASPPIESTLDGNSIISRGHPKKVKEFIDSKLFGNLT